MCLEVLLERLRNETTRLTAVKAWGTLAGSPLVPSLGAALEPLVAELTSFLRKANRRLRQTALTTNEVGLPRKLSADYVRSMPLKHCVMLIIVALMRHSTHHAVQLLIILVEVHLQLLCLSRYRKHQRQCFPTCRWWSPDMAVRSTLRRWQQQCTRWHC